MAAERQVNGINVDVLGEVIAEIQHDPAYGQCQFRATNRWVGGTRNDTSVSTLYCANQEMAHGQTFTLQADEPTLLAGNDQYPNPVEHLLNALAGCLTTAMVAHAAVQGIKVEEVESLLEGDLDLRGLFGLAAQVPKGYSEIRVTFKVKTAPENLAKLQELAGFSPVYNTLLNATPIRLNFELK